VASAARLAFAVTRGEFDEMYGCGLGACISLMHIDCPSVIADKPLVGQHPICGLRCIALPTFVRGETLGATNRARVDRGGGTNTVTVLFPPREV